MTISSPSSPASPATRPTADPNLLDLNLDASTTGLPGVLLDELILQLRDAPLKFERKSLNRADAIQPSITYGIDDDEIVLVLPTPRADADRPWRVSFDGEVSDFHSSRRWGGDVQSARIAIPGPIREAVISHPALLSSSALTVVVKADPLLTFDKNGRWIPRRDGLKDSVWAVFPEDHQIVDGSTLEPVEIRDLGSPAGWRGWRSAFIELEHVTSLQLHAAGAVVGSQRWVRKDARPTFVLGATVPGVFSTDGRCVYASRPRVMLPASSTDPGPVWSVRVRRFGDTE